MFEANAGADPQRAPPLEPAHEAVLWRDAHVAYDVNPLGRGIGSGIDEALERAIDGSRELDGGAPPEAGERVCFGRRGGRTRDG